MSRGQSVLGLSATSRLGRIRHASDNRHEGHSDGLRPSRACLLTSPIQGQTRPADDSESISLIPSSIKQWKYKLTLDNRSHDVLVQYAVREHTTKERPTLFVFPAWVVQKVERKIGNQRTELAPGDPLVPPNENRPVQLDVTIRNLLENEGTENLILDALKRYVAKQLGQDTPNFRFEKPHLNDAEVRFTLFGRGRGEETEMALSNAVKAADDGVLGFDLDLDAIRRCEQLHGYTGGLALGNTSILPSGPIKVRFERLEFEI